jgi:hypothetical protein
MLCSRESCLELLYTQSWLYTVYLKRSRDTSSNTPLYCIEWSAYRQREMCRFPNREHCTVRFAKQFLSTTVEQKNVQSTATSHRTLGGKLQRRSQCRRQLQYKRYCAVLLQSFLWAWNSNTVHQHRTYRPQWRGYSTVGVETIDTVQYFWFFLRHCLVITEFLYCTVPTFCTVLYSTVQCDVNWGLPVQSMERLSAGKKRFWERKICVGLQ